MIPRQILPIGQVVDSRYKVVKVLGQGAVGAVYLVEDVVLDKGKAWALKELAPIQPNPDDQGRFKREAEILFKLDHPNLPKIDNFFDDNGKFYLVMDYIEGENLGSMLIRKPGGFSERRVKEWLRVLLDILAYLHSHHPPIYFRDIKPLNIIIDKKGKLWLVDAGSAIFKPQGISGPIPTSGVTGQKALTAAIGTPEYCPPEQMYQVDERTDIYNLGATILHLLTGSLAVLKFGTPIRPVSKVKPGISEEFSSLIRGMTEFDFRDRFQKVSEIMAKANLGRFRSLEYMPHIEVAEIEKLISIDKGNKLAFDDILLEKYQGLINYFSHQLYRQAVNQIDELEDAFDQKKTQHILFSSDPAYEKKRAEEHLIFLKRAKFYILYKYLGDCQKAEKAVLELVNMCEDLNNMLLLAEFYEVVGKLEEAKEQSEKTAKKYCSAPEAFQKVHEIEKKLENKKTIKRLENTATGIKLAVSGNAQSFKKQSSNAWQYIKVGKNWWQDFVHLFTDFKTFSTMMGSVLMAVIASGMISSWMYHIKDFEISYYLGAILGFLFLYAGGLSLKHQITNKKSLVESYAILTLGLALLISLAVITSMVIPSNFSWGEKYAQKKKIYFDMEKPGWGQFVENQKKEKIRLEKEAEEARILKEAEEARIIGEASEIRKKSMSERNFLGSERLRISPFSDKALSTPITIPAETPNPEEIPGPTSESTKDFTPTEPPVMISSPQPSPTNTTGSPLEIPTSDVKPNHYLGEKTPIPSPTPTKPLETSSPVPTKKPKDADQIIPSKATPPVFQGGN